MEYKMIQGVSLPVLGLGTWNIGAAGEKADHSHDREHLDAIRRALDCGMTHIDTAEIYGDGHAEELVGEAIKGYDRTKLFLTTKVAPRHLPHRLLDSVRHSLRRLNTEYIDLYLVHSPPHPFSEVMQQVLEALDHLVDQGVIRTLGVSNFRLAEVQESQTYTKNPIFTNQVAYSVVEKPERALVRWCHEGHLMLTAYRPIKSGQLTAGRLRTLDEVSQKYQKTPLQVALRWLLDQPNVIAIPKTTSKVHLEEIQGCLGWHLEEEDGSRLEQSV